MSLLKCRTERGLTLAQCAVELGLSSSSAGWISEIENGKKDASLRLAMRIQTWSGGQVTAASVNAEIREAEAAASGAGHEPTMAPAESVGAGNSDANISRTERVS